MALLLVAIVAAVTFAVVCVQFEVLVSDQSDPERTDTATVDVTVIRDTFAPRFLSTPYSTIVDFNAVVGSSIFRVTATDDDQVVSTPRSGRAHGPWTDRLGGRCTDRLGGRWTDRLGGQTGWVDVRETCERRGEAHMFFPKRIDTTFSRIKFDVECVGRVDWMLDG